MPSKRPKVLIDMSPLDTPSRLRGIGQYILGLASGIRELEKRGELELEVNGLANFDAQGRCGGTCGLAYQGTMVHPEGFPTQEYRRRKRRGLMLAAEAEGCDLVHVTEPGVIVKGTRIARVVTAYDLIPLVLHKEYLGREPWARLYCRWKETQYYENARRILAISESTRRDVVTHLGVPEELVDVAYLGADHQRFRPEAETDDESVRLASRYALQRPFLFYIGAFDSRKNIDLLIRAFARAKLAADFDLVLAGAIMGQRRQELSDLAMSSGVSAAVRFLGYVEDSDIAALYRACHVHVFPSKYEGFGLPLAEALACGAPTITTSATSMPEIAGDAAVLVPASDLAALSEALRSLCGSESRRAELRRAGPKQSARFSWLECARQTVRSYRKALGA